jgi:hypothetical protein
MKTTILLLITRPAPLLTTPTKIVSIIIRMRRWGAAGERVEPSYVILREVVRYSIGAIARHMLLLHLVCLLLGIKHHLLISPLC